MQCICNIEMVSISLAKSLISKVLAIFVNVNLVPDLMLNLYVFE